MGVIDRLNAPGFFRQKQSLGVMGLAVRMADCLGGVRIGLDSQGLSDPAANGIDNVNRSILSNGYEAPGST